MNKKVLIMCTGNSCRSIIGEALINKHLKGIDAYSCGVAPSGKVNLNAQKILKANNAWKESYYSKHLDELIDIEFDLVVTVCDHANETCPMFPKVVKKIHVNFEDPDGKEYEVFQEVYRKINDELLYKVKEELKKDYDVNC